MKHENTARKENIVDLADAMSAQANAERAKLVGENHKTVPIKREKLPLIREKKKPKDFPCAALLSLQPVVDAVSNITQAPEAIVVQGVLGPVNYAVQPHADVDAGFGQKPLSCYWAVAAKSGERKSATDTLTWGPVQERQDELVALLGNDCQDPDAGGKVKISPILLVTEPTAEGMISHLERSVGSVALSTDEGGSFIGGYALSKEQALKTMAKLSSLWDGKPISSMRAGSTKSRFAAHKRLNVSIMAQPAVMARLLASPVARDQGFLSRCLLSEPETKIGTRKFRRASSDDKAVVDEFRERLRGILHRPFPLMKGSANNLDPRVVRLSKQAVALLAEFADQVEAECAPGGRLALIADFGSKAPEHAMRIGATLALWEDLEAPRINARYIAAGIEIVSWYVTEALRLNGAELDVDLDLSHSLLCWLQERKDIGEEFSLVEIYQRGPGLIRSAKTARRCMGILAEHGWVESVEGSVEFDGLPRREVFRLI